MANIKIKGQYTKKKTITELYILSSSGVAHQKTNE